MSDLVVKISADISRLDAGIREAETKVSSFGDVLKGSFLGGIGANIATSAFSTLTGAVTNAFHALAEVDKISGQTAAVIKSTGGAAGVTADQVAALADQLERKTGIEAESIQRGQNLLLTFTNIKDAAGANNDIFTQTTKIMADLGTAMGTDASSAAIQLGKALNDPTQGITALTRVGVTFTDAQKEQIKALQASGDMMGAQRVILAELRKEFGGSADALGKTFGGALERAKNGLGSISEAMLQSNVPLFTTALSKAADAAYAVSDAITKGDIAGLIDRAFGPGAKALITGLSVALGVQMVGSMRTVAAQAVTMGQAYARAAAAMVIANAPVVAAIAAISFAAYPFIKNWDKVKDLFSAVWQTMKNVVNSAMQYIGEASRNAWQIISGHFSAAYSNFKAFFIGPVARALGSLFDALPQKLKDALGGFTMPKITFDVPGVGAAFQEVKSIASDALDTVTGGLMIAKEQFTETWKDLPGEISGVMKGFTSSITGASQAAVAGLKPVNAALDKLGGDAKVAHEKAGKAADAHAKNVKQLANPYIDLGKVLFGTMGKANDLLARIQAAKWAKMEQETKDYVKAVGEMEKPLKDAELRLRDMDSAAKYWGDTSDKTSEKMAILRAAIDDARARGIDPANMSLETAKRRYDELAASQGTAALTVGDFSKAIGGIGQALNAVTGTFAIFGGGDSPIVGFLNKVNEGIRLFDTWVQGVNGLQTAIDALGGMGAVIGVLTAPITLIVAGIGLIIWAAKDAVEAFGGWPKVFDTIALGWQKFALAFATIGEAIVGGTVNFISWAWTGLVNGIKTGANFIIDAINGVIDGINAMLSALPENMGGGNRLGRLERFATEEFKPIQIDFTSQLKADMEKTQARLAEAPAMKEWRVSNPIEDITNAVQGLMSKPQETQTQPSQIVEPKPYRIQSLASDLREPMGGQAPSVTVNYYGNGKWTREDAQQIGALIVNEVKAAGVR